MKELSTRLPSPSSWAPWTRDAEGSRAGDLSRWIFYVSVPVQLKVLIPYMVGDVTCCSEGCVVYKVFDVFVVHDGGWVALLRQLSLHWGAWRVWRNRDKPGEQSQAERSRRVSPIELSELRG